jgi:predicted membrane channel-forming protein YqfA (hemolysin III family)
MRRFALLVVLVATTLAPILIVNVLTDWLGGWWFWTVMPLIGMVAAFGLALELLYVSRRIERSNFAKPS